MKTTDPLVARARLDGRNIDPEVGALGGEGAQQRVRRIEPDLRAREEGLEGEGPSYHGVALLQEPVWRWEIPAYFFTGGLAGACAVLGATAQVAGGGGTELLVRRCRLVALGGAGVSAFLLIRDLGRPERFLNMLRVFRPTAPMNMGTWLLSAFGALSGVAALPDLLGLVRSRRERWPRPRIAARSPMPIRPWSPAAWRSWRAGRSPDPWRRRAVVPGVADAAGIAAGMVGLPLVGYTGVLLADTAVPIWQATRNTLPMLFAFSGAVSAGGLFQLWPVQGDAGEMAFRFGLVAKGGEVALSRALHLEARIVPRVEEAIRRGHGRALLSFARGALLASAALDLLPGRRTRRWRRGLAGALALAGTAAVRFGVIAAGRVSARDPHASFEMQRAGRGATEVATKVEAPPRMPTLPGIEATGKESSGDGAAP
jgi:formate-dependent nitrite reductase membrane component NrfD